MAETPQPESQSEDAKVGFPKAREKETPEKVMLGTIVATRSVPFVTTPAHKSARTRAWRTFQAFSADQAEAISPANVFVTLPVSTDGLKQSGISTIKTKWENKVAQREADLAQQSTHTIRISDSSQAQFNDGVDHTNQSSVPLSFEHVRIKDTVGEDGVWRKDPCGYTAEATKPSVGTDEHGALERDYQHASPQPATQTSSIHNTASLLPQQLEQLGSINVPIKEFEERVTDTYEPAKSSRTVFSAIASPLEHPKPWNADAQPPSPHKRYRPVTGRIDENNRLASETGKKVAKENISLPFQASISDTVVNSSTALNHTGSSYSSTVVLPGSEVIVAESQTPADKTSNFKVTHTAPCDFSSRNSSACRDHINSMAPVRDPSNVESSLKEAIQKLFEIQSQVHGFVPETQPLLIEKMTELAQSLSNLQTLTSPTLSPNNPIHKNRIAPEVIDYVDDSRNPDIYNREFVELVQRGNAVMNGKQQAFKDFSLTFAEKLKRSMPELSGQVDRIMANAKMDGQQNSSQVVAGDNTNGAGKPERKFDGGKDAEASTNGARNT